MIELSRGVRPRARGPRGRRHHPHRRGPARVLLRRRPARPRRRPATSATTGAHGRPLPRHRPAGADPPAAEAGRRDGRRLRDRRRARAARRLRPDDRRRQRALRPDRARASARSTAASAPSLLARPRRARRRRKEIWFLCRQYDAQQALDMGLVNTVVPLDRLEEETVAWCREMLALSPLRAAPAEGELQRGTRTAGRHPAARARRQPALLHVRGGAGGARGLQGEAHARLLAVPARPERSPMRAPRRPCASG